MFVVQDHGSPTGGCPQRTGSHPLPNSLSGTRANNSYVSGDAASKVGVHYHCFGVIVLAGSGLSVHSRSCTEF